jgi:hypothetical protein
MIARGLAISVGALILAAIAHVNVVSNGGYWTPQSYLTIARIMDSSSPATTGSVPMLQIQVAACPNPAAQAATPMASAPLATAISARRPIRSMLTESTHELQQPCIPAAGLD